MKNLSSVYTVYTVMTTLIFKLYIFLLHNNTFFQNLKSESTVFVHPLISKKQILLMAIHFGNKNYTVRITISSYTRIKHPASFENNSQKPLRKPTVTRNKQSHYVSHHQEKKIHDKSHHVVQNRKTKATIARAKW